VIWPAGKPSAGHAVLYESLVAPAADPGFARSGFERQRSARMLKELSLTSEQILDDLRE